MNSRRDILKAAAGLATMSVASPMVVEKFGGIGQGVMCGSAQPAAPTPTEPPKDLRTPQQVLDDDVKSDIRQIIEFDNSEYWKHTRYVPRYTFEKLEAALIERGLPVTKIDLMSGSNVYALVVNGNVIVSL